MKGLHLDHQQPLMISILFVINFQIGLMNLILRPVSVFVLRFWQFSMLFIIKNMGVSSFIIDTENGYVIPFPYNMIVTNNRPALHKCVCQSVISVRLWCTYTLSMLCGKTLKCCY